MITKLFSAIAAVAAVLTLAIVSAPGTVPVAAVTQSSVAELAPTNVPPATQGRVLPFAGIYQGVDTHHRLVRFIYTNGRIVHFQVNHTRFPDAQVMGHQWHHTCAHNLCTRGHWSTDITVEGRWNDATQGGEVHFTAQLVAHYNG